MLKVLVVDDDDTLRLTVRSALEPNGYEVTEASNGLLALQLVESKGPFDFVILDVNMPEMSGLEALTKIKELSPETAVLIVTAFSNVQDAVTAIKNGAYDYLEKPVDAERIMRLIDSANQAHKMVEIASFSAPRLNFDEGRSIIGGSSPMAKIFDLIYKLSKVETSVLIRGESGTGKELVARALHFNSHRKRGPFVAVNCAAIPENLIESELFGHEKGSFTGADKKKIGKFQYANGGTIFLDEIGDISPQMQVKLLRVLQEKKFTPVGANQEINAEVRIIAATNRPLEKMIEAGTFRADLFYRLNVLPIQLPPLRARREDIPQLVQYLLKKFNDIHNRRITGLSKDAVTALRVYSWPGNIRELENVIEHAFIIESSDVIHASALPEHIQATVHRSGAVAGNDVSGSTGIESFDSSAGTGIPDGDSDDLNYPALKEKFEKEFIIRALKAFNGRINQTAEHTQMTKVTLLRKLDKYGINPKEYHRL
jgi:DNA-binding NtrC family response regulator